MYRHEAILNDVLRRFSIMDLSPDQGAQDGQQVAQQRAVGGGVSGLDRRHAVRPILIKIHDGGASLKFLANWYLFQSWCETLMHSEI